MRLEILAPPALVTVDRAPALLLAVRGDRRYVQVSAGPGLNSLRGVEAARVGPPEDAVPVQSVLPTTRFGLPRAER